MKALLNGKLDAALLETVAGRPVRGELALLQATRPAFWREKQLLFLAEKGASDPFALVKWARGVWAEGLEREQAAMTFVRGAGGPLALACPLSWGPFHVGDGALFTIERYLPSRAAYAELRNSLWPRGVLERHFSRVSHWLVDFALATRQPARTLDEALFAEQIMAPLLTFAERFGPAFAPPEALERTIQMGRAHIGRQVGFSAEHGDLWPSNVLIPRAAAGIHKGIYVVDWEHFLPVSLTGFDMLFFCTTYSREFPWRPFAWLEPAEALQRTYIRETWLGSRIRGLLEHNCAALGIQRSFIPVLLPVLMARIALRHANSTVTTQTDTEEYWSAALRTWFNRPSDNWLESWAREQGV